MANTKKVLVILRGRTALARLGYSWANVFEVARVAMFVGFHDGGGRVWSAVAAVGLSFVEVRQ